MLVEARAGQAHGTGLARGKITGQASTLDRSRGFGEPKEKGGEERARRVSREETRPSRNCLGDPPMACRAARKTATGFPRGTFAAVLERQVESIRGNRPGGGRCRRTNRLRF